jgi:hypothetical protein
MEMCFCLVCSLFILETDSLLYFKDGLLIQRKVSIGNVLKAIEIAREFYPDWKDKRWYPFYLNKYLGAQLPLKCFQHTGSC